jgi:hypothetical protein
LAIRIGACLRDLGLIAAGFALLERLRRTVAFALVVCVLALATAGWAFIV